MSDAWELAELMGYERQSRNQHELEIYRWLSPDGTPLRHQFTLRKVADAALPDFPHDLNAMCDAEESLPIEHLWDYVKEVIRATQDINLDDEPCQVEPNYWSILTVSAKARMDAMIKVLKEVK